MATLAKDWLLTLKKSYM